MKPSSSFVTGVFLPIIVVLSGKATGQQYFRDFENPNSVFSPVNAISINSPLDDLTRLAIENAIPEPYKILLQNPELLAGVYENISSADCVGHLKYINAQLAKVLLNPLVPPDIAIIHMLDSWGKIPSGIFSGHLISPGDFSECVNARGIYNGSDPTVSTDLRGSYCLGAALPAGLSLGLPGRTAASHDDGFGPGAISSRRAAGSVEELLKNIINGFGTIQMFPAWGTCFPASCPVEDVRQYLTNVFGLIPFANITAIIFDCHTSEKEPLDGPAITVTFVLATMVGLCAVAAIIDIVLNEKSNLRAGALGQFINCFSWYTNARKLVSTHVGRDDVSCIHGIRFFSICWVVLGHTYTYYMIQFVWNAIDARDTYKDLATLSVINAYVAVDTFFVLSGTLVAYNILKELDARGKLNVPMLYLHRYLRLTPVYFLAIGIFATLVPYLGNGPSWFYTESEAHSCRKVWWHNILYINTIIDYQATATQQPDKCYGPAWYIANDMLYFIVSPIFVYTLWRWRKVGLGLTAAWILQTTIYLLVETSTYDCAMGGNGTSPNRTYDVPWARANPYAVGILLGYLLHLRRRNPNIFQGIPHWAIALGWTVSTVSALAIQMGPYELLQPENAAKYCGTVDAIFYGSFHRLAWGIVIAWIIFACVNGYGGIVNSFLSWKVFIPLGRLTYCTYIFSPEIQIIHALIMYRPFQYSTYQSVYDFLGHLTFSLMFAFVASVTIEAPCMQIEKLIFQPQKRREGPVRLVESEEDHNEPQKVDGNTSSNPQV